MKEMMIEGLNVLMPSLLAALVALLGFAVQKFTVYIKREGLATELEAKEKYAAIVVAAAEQMYKEADGPRKMQHAKSQFVDFLSKNKIKFTDAELDDLLEAAVKSVKNGVSEGLADENGAAENV